MADPFRLGIPLDGLQTKRLMELEHAARGGYQGWGRERDGADHDSQFFVDVAGIRHRGTTLNDAIGEATRSLKRFTE